MPELLGKTALVTGASRGIGRASALALARKGAQVLVHYGRGKAEADGVVNEIRQRGGRAQAIGADLTTAVGAHQIAKQVREIVGDRLDVLVANAGVSKSASIEETTVEDLDHLFAVNRGHRYVELHQDRSGSEIRAEYAGASTSRRAGRHRAGCGFSCLRRCPLDHGRHGAGRRRVEALREEL